jgi:hypothetical protein
MLNKRVKKDIKHFDPFTPSEYLNLLNIIRLNGKLSPECITLKGDSFTLEKDLVLRDYIHLDGIFTQPYEINKSSFTITILKNSFFQAGQENMGKLSLTMEGHIRIARTSADDITYFPDALECRLHSAVLFEECTEIGLISRRKVFYEKTFHHYAIVTGSSPAWEESNPGHSVKGYFKIDASSGNVLEEINE